MGLGDKLMSIGDAWAIYQSAPTAGKVAIGVNGNLDNEATFLEQGLDFLARTPAEVTAHTRWVNSVPGRRPYHDHLAMQAEARRRGLDPSPRKLVFRLGHVLFNMDYKVKPAPLRQGLDADERARMRALTPHGLVLIEPHIKANAPPSKRWPFERFAAVATELQRAGHAVMQVGQPEQGVLPGVEVLKTKSFRDVLPALGAARLYIGPEGGLHHASAGMNTPGVIIFGGFTPPSITGYDIHVNLTGGAQSFCGTKSALCPHCVEHMSRISADEVVAHALNILQA